jgi:hypothetical protein
MSSRKKTFLALMTLMLIGALSLPAFAAEKSQAGNSPWTIYTNSQVRWGSNDRTIFTLDVLVPLYQGEKNILFFNSRLNKDDRQGSEVNLGFGYRHLLFSDKAVLGVNGYYDARWTGWGTRHEQVGIGAEVMTEWVTGRMNGYFALTDPQISGMTGPSSGYYFRDIGLYTGSGSLEETLGGFDGEVGFKIPYLSKYVETWVYAGGYHFQGDYVNDVNGFSSRVEVIPTDFLRLNFEYRNDTLNHDQYYGEVAVAVPFSIENLLSGKNPFEGIGSHIGGERTLKERMVEPVRRDVDVQVYVVGSGPDAPGTETLVEDIVFVSETGDDTTGEGTFEKPYKSIDWAVDDPRIAAGCSIIHVINDEANPGSSAEGGVIDSAGLLIWGSGVDNPLYPIISNMTSGYPDVVAYNGNTFVLSVDAADTTITGLGLTTPSGPPGDVYGINLNNAQGLEISYNNIGSGIMNGYGIYSNLSGSNIGTSGAPALFAYNTIELVGGSNATGIYLGADTIYADFTANTITGSSGITDGITLVSTGDIGSSGTPVTFNGNIINLDCAEIRGITYTAGLADYDVSSIDFAGIMGGDYSSLPAVTGSGSAYVDMTNNVISESGGVASLGITGIAVGDNVATLTDNTIAVTGADIASGITLFAGNGLDATITDTGDVTPFGVSGGTAALGITGVGLGLSGGLTHLHIDHNTLTVASNIAASGILAGSGAGLDASITFNNITGIGGYAALGITAFGANYLGAGGTTVLDISDNTLGLTSPDGGVSGILIGAGGDLYSQINRNIITGDGYYAALGITGIGTNVGSAASPMTIEGNDIDLDSDGGAISGILLASLGNLRSEIVDNEITGYGEYAALGITEFALDDFGRGNRSGVYDNRIDIDSNYFASGVALGAGGDLRVDVTENYLDLNSIYDEVDKGGLLALGVTLVNYDGVFNARVNDNEMYVTATGADLPVADMIDFLNGLSLPTGLDPAYFSTYNIGAASGIMALSIEGTYTPEIRNNDISVTGNSLAGGITAANISGDIGSETDPLLINDNELVVYANGGGDLVQLIADLLSSYGVVPSLTLPEGFDGAASGIAMLTGGDIYARVNRNDLGVYGSLGALGITAFGDDIGSEAAPLLVNNNYINMESDYVSSAILMVAMNRLNAQVSNTNADADPGDYSILGGVAALGITGIALNLTDDGNNVVATGNDLYLGSGGFTSGILLASLNNLNFNVQRNEIHGEAEYAALGITALSGDDIGYGTPAVVSNNKISLNSDYVSSGILLFAADELTANVRYNDLSDPIEGGVAALGISALSIAGDINANINYNDLNVIAAGGEVPFDDIISFLNPLVDTGLDPSYYGSYNLGIGSGILVASLEGDIYGTVSYNGNTGEPGTMFSVTGNSAAGGIVMASYDGSLYSTISHNALTVTSSGTAAIGPPPVYGIDTLLTDITTDLGDPILYTALFPSFDGTASGITLVTGTGGIYSNVSNNPAINVTGASLATGVFMYAWDGDIGAEGDPLLINGNTMTVTSGFFGSGIVGFAGWDIDDGTTSSGGPRSLYATINNNAFSVTSPVASAAYLDVSGWIGSSTTPLNFHNNSGTISGVEQVMLALVGDSGTSGTPNYVRWGNNSGLTTGLGSWIGNFPISGTVLGAVYLDSYDPSTHTNPLYWGWNISPKTIP